MHVTGKGELLLELYQARLDRLREICIEHDLPKTGSVEMLRAKLIQKLVLDDWDFSSRGILALLNEELGIILGIFGVKKSGSIRERRQRLWLHLNHDAKQMTPENLDNLSREELHQLCVNLELPRSGTKQALLLRVGGVLTSQLGSWGAIKKSLRRPRSVNAIPIIPMPKNIHSPYEEPEEQFLDVDKPNDMQDSEEVIVPIQDESNFEVFEEEIVEEHTPQETTQRLDVQQSASKIIIEARMPEIDALCRDYLSLSSSQNKDETELFIDSLKDHGFDVQNQHLREEIWSTIRQIESKILEEKSAISSAPNSWLEREALRKYENVRSHLREEIHQLLSNAKGNIVEARMRFEEKSREMGLDMRIPSISGRVHALFDLQLSLNEEYEMNNPNVSRKVRVLKVLQHGAVHLHHKTRLTLDRLERSYDSFEQLVEAILEKSEGDFSESQQSLLIRFLEKKGFEVNVSEVRPRVLAAAGVIGTELGFISPSQIPKLAPGIVLDDAGIESVITELQALAQKFKTSNQPTEAEPEMEMAESVSEAHNRVATMRNKIDNIDNILAKLYQQEL
ncbi:MAG TPA: hypothetical protein HA279_00190 [Candidatus Poseidoniaceae archaeon]|nr:hypothetical protein [Candidatus Poseidoniaceae archaeon]|tara:strand:- start:463 stop:2157 length:1695 start_codon:yes stop_codon:yes gene_type:complete